MTFALGVAVGFSVPLFFLWYATRGMFPIKW
jgi:hypothetical protein